MITNNTQHLGIKLMIKFHTVKPLLLTTRKAQLGNSNTKMFGRAERKQLLIEYHKLNKSLMSSIRGHL